MWIYVVVRKVINDNLKIDRVEIERAFIKKEEADAWALERSKVNRDSSYHVQETFLDGTGTERIKDVLELICPITKEECHASGMYPECGCLLLSCHKVTKLIDSWRKDHDGKELHEVLGLSPEKFAYSLGYYHSFKELVSKVGDSCKSRIELLSEMLLSSGVKELKDFPSIVPVHPDAEKVKYSLVKDEPLVSIKCLQYYEDYHHGGITVVYRSNLQDLTMEQEERVYNYLFDKAHTLILKKNQEQKKKEESELAKQQLEDLLRKG